MELARLVYIRNVCNFCAHTCLLARDSVDMIGMRLAIQGGTCALVPTANLYKNSTHLIIIRVEKIYIYVHI